MIIKEYAANCYSSLYQACCLGFYRLRFCVYIVDSDVVYWMNEVKIEHDRTSVVVKFINNLSKA